MTGPTPFQIATTVRPADTLADGPRLHLKMDLLVPKTGGAQPLVVYIPGGAFLRSAKDGPPERRAHLAEAGFSVASVVSHHPPRRDLCRRRRGREFGDPLPACPWQ